MEILEVRQPLEEQDAFDDPVRVLHLVDALLIGLVGERVVAPVLEDARMEEILVDGGQFVGQHAVQKFDDLSVALHVQSSLGSARRAAILDAAAARR